MALTERSAEWKLTIALPEWKDTIGKVTEVWNLTVTEPISCGYQEFPVSVPFKVTATTGRTLQGAELLIKIEGEVSTECRRCLSPLTVAINEEFMYSYILQSDVAEKVQEEEEFYSSDAVVLPVTRLGSSINVSDLVWECIIESLPAYETCPEGCVGAEAFLSSEDRIDPRLLALAELLEKEKK